MRVCSKGQAFPRSAPVPPAEGPKLDVCDFAVDQQLVSSRLMCGRGLWRMGSIGWHRQGGATELLMNLLQVISPGWGDGRSAVPATSFVACLRAVFRNLEELVTSCVCSFHPTIRLG